jgi:hypothetical protein
MKLPGHIRLDIGDEFSLIVWQVSCLGRYLVHGHDKCTLCALLLLHEEVFETEIESGVRDHVHVRHEGEVGLAAALGDVAHQVLRILQRGSPFCVFGRLGKANTKLYQHTVLQLLVFFNDIFHCW